MSNKLFFENLCKTFFFSNKYSVLPKKYYYSTGFDLKNCSLANKMVLDFGCGLGIFSLYAALVANASKVYALDDFKGHGGSVKNYERLRLLLKRYNLTNKITLIKANGVTYDFSGQTFDVIYCANVLHHIFPKMNDDTAMISKFFSKLKKLLKIGGIVVVQEVMRHNISEYVPRFFNFMKIDWKAKRNATEWAKIFYKAGFKQVNTRYFVPNIFYRKPLRFFTNNPIFSFFYFSRYVLECR